jgi:hypothetical protein
VLDINKQQRIIEVLVTSGKCMDIEEISKETAFKEGEVLFIIRQTSRTIIEIASIADGFSKTKYKIGRKAIKV